MNQLLPFNQSCAWQRFLQLPVDTGNTLNSRAKPAEIPFCAKFCQHQHLQEDGAASCSAPCVVTPGNVGAAESRGKNLGNRENTASVLHFNCSIWQNSCHFGSGNNELLHSCSERQKKQSPRYSMETFYEIKSTAKPSFHQILKSEVFNRILGTALRNSDTFQAPDRIYVFI